MAQPTDTKDPQGNGANWFLELVGVEVSDVAIEVMLDDAIDTVWADTSAVIAEPADHPEPKVEIRPLLPEASYVRPPPHQTLKPSALSSSDLMKLEAEPVLVATAEGVDGADLAARPALDDARPDPIGPIEPAELPDAADARVPPGTAPDQPTLPGLEVPAPGTAPDQPTLPGLEVPDPGTGPPPELVATYLVGDETPAPQVSAEVSAPVEETAPADESESTDTLAPSTAPDHDDPDSLPEQEVRISEEPTEFPDEPASGDPEDVVDLTVPRDEVVTADESTSDAGPVANPEELDVSESVVPSPIDYRTPEALSRRMSGGRRFRVVIGAAVLVGLVAVVLLILPQMSARQAATEGFAAVLLLVGAVVVLLGRPGPTSCADLPDLETAFAEADVVFIGVVAELSNHNRTAVMEVEQVWKGPQLADVVTVHGGPDDPGMVTSVDRTFDRGTYVVFPVNSTPPFEDNACTLTQRTTSALDVINPFAAEPADDPNALEAVTTTFAAGGSPAFTAANAGGVATLQPDVTRGGGIQPWAVGVGIGVALLVVGIDALWRLAWRRF